MKNCDLLRASSLLLISAALAFGQTKPALDSKYGNLPLSFEANQGQTDSHVRFLSRGQGYSLFLTDLEAVLSLQHNGKDGDVVRMQLLGANQKTHVKGLEQLPGKSNYFVGNDPSKWRSNVPTYGRVSYKDVYPGVDLVYYGNQKQLEYDFVVAPGADTKPIQLHFAGARRVRLDGDGNLQIVGLNRQVSLEHPVVYQVLNGLKQPVEGRFTLIAQGTVGFALGKYDRRRPLVIDPTLTYSTYLGGTGFAPPAAGNCCGDSVHGIAVDLFGSAYVVGTTGSTDFPVSPTAFQIHNNDAQDQISGGAANVFVSKLDPTGSTLVYSTYLGGTGDYWYKDSGAAIAVDTSGNAYVTGYTGSNDFPVTANAFQKVNRAAASVGRNAFVTKLTADGSGLLYSTYLGGTGFNNGVARDGEYGTGIAVDSLGDAYVVGSSYSQDFPVTPAAFQKTNNAWPIRQTNPFVTKLNAAGSALIYSTYVGGTGFNEACCYFFEGADYATGIAVDSSGDAFITGFAHSKDFPVTANAFQKQNKAHLSINATGASDTNAFVTKLNPSGSGLLYSTYVGGSGSQYYGDQANAIAIDPLGYAYITGQASSLDFPTTPGAFQTTNHVVLYEVAAFVTKVNLDGSDLVYSTYISGSGKHLNKGDYANGIAVDSLGQASIIGTTISSDFPVTADAFQHVNNQGTFPAADYYSGNAFLSQFGPTGALAYSTYFGGSGIKSGTGGDFGLAIALDIAGNAYIAGQTLSIDFPVTVGAYQTINKANAAGRPGATNAFIAEFGGFGLPLIPTSTTLKTSINPQVAGSNVTFTANVSDLVGTSPSGNVSFKIDGTVASIVALNSSGQAVYSTSTIPVGQHTIAADYSGTTTLAPSSASLSETINAGSVSVTFSTVPLGLGYSIDGTAYSAQQTLTLPVGSNHIIATASPQGSGGTQYIFSKWSDGGALSHNITVNAAGTYTATFSTSYLLNILSSPAAGGSVTPASGGYYAPATNVGLTATPASGYTFSGWSGNVANSSSASTTVTMSGPETVTASFVPSGAAALFGNIIGKSGPTNARVWNIQVSNNGPGAAAGSQITGLLFVQAGGVACSPTIISSLPVGAGNLAPAASATVPITLNFNGCAANSRFIVTASLSANSGGASGSIVRLNQFQ